MLKRALALLAAGGALLALAALAGGERLRLRLAGAPAPARVVGLVLERPGSRDLVAGLQVELRLLAADGSAWEISARDHRVLSARRLAPDGAAETVDPTLLAEDAATSPLAPPFRRLVREAVRGDANALRWALRREERRTPAPDRVLRVEKTETAAAFLDAPPLAPGDLALAPGDGALLLRGAPPAPAAVVTRAVFSREDPEALAARRGESLASYEQTRLGAPTTPARRDFVLHCEPYSTVFRPVSAHAAADGQHPVTVGAVGRKGGPLPSLPLFGPARVRHDPADPARAVLLAEPGPPGRQPLEWFGRVCEGVFTLWGPPLVLALAAAFFALGGLLVLSLALLPPRTPRAPDHA